MSFVGSWCVLLFCYAEIDDAKMIKMNMKRAFKDQYGCDEDV